MADPAPDIDRYQTATVAKLTLQGIRNGLNPSLDQDDVIGSLREPACRKSARCRRNIVCADGVEGPNCR